VKFLGNKNKMKSKEKNSFLKTNYKKRSTETKFNSIGKIISMNYPFLQNNSEKKQRYNDKNFIKPENIFLSAKKEKGSIKKVNVNLSQAFNIKNQNEIGNNFSEKKLYGTKKNFNMNPSPNNEKNALPKLNINIKEDNNKMKEPFLQKNDMMYQSYFQNNNKFQKRPNKNVNQTHNIFFSRSSEKYKKFSKKVNLHENKSNDSFTIKNNKMDNKLFNSSEYKTKFVLNKKIKKKENNNLINSQEVLNDLNNNNANSKSNTPNNYIISNYGSFTLGGTDAFGRVKTNQDSFLVKEEDTLSNNKEYTFGVFDGHGLQGHLVSEAIKIFLQNCSFEQYQTKKKIIEMFCSLSLAIENSRNFDIFCSGSTAVLVHVSKEKIICANCGDSRAILISTNNGGSSIFKLSRDHKPNLLDEKKRIIAAGGRVDRIYGMGPYRVWFKDGDYPGLAMSRSIGDTLAHKIGVSDLPEIMEFSISKTKPIAIVVASDGVWEFMNNEQVKNIVIKYRNSHDSLGCSKEIVEKARQIWKGTTYAIDDITCVVAFFDKI
jgi:serine/threonine protein phosphatase PrpC